MAKSKPLKWRTVIVIDGVERTIAESDGMGNDKRHMSEEELKKKKKITFIILFQKMDLSILASNPDCD